MKPVIILPQKAMSDADIDIMRQNGICVVVAKDPAAVKFIDPLPALADRSGQEQAAVMLSRKILGPGFWSSDDTRKLMAETYVDILLKGTALDPKPTEKEMERVLFTAEKRAEIAKIAREEARAERLAEKEARAKRLQQPPK